jgi:Cohesin domain
MRPYFGVLMRFLSALILIIIFSFLSVFTVHAQAAETIWIQANTTSYKTGETVIATINAITATPIQGFTAQIRYDPACLQPVNGTSPIAGMNGLAVPQESGLVDASFASTTPQTVNGVLAEVRFVTLKGCQTDLAIETAALVIRNESGFAAPLAGVSIDNKSVSLNIDSATGSPQPAIAGDSVLPLAPTIFPEPQPVNRWVVVLLVLIAGIAITTVIVVFKLSRK